jgi:myosin heavy subunit
MSTIRIKAKHNDVTRAFTLVPPPLDSNLANKEKLLDTQNRIAKLFSLSCAPTLSYIDEDNDSIVIGSDQELAFACNLSKTLTLQVQETITVPESKKVEVKPQTTENEILNVGQEKRFKQHERRGKVDKELRSDVDREQKRLKCLNARTERIRNKIEQAEGDEKTKLEQQLAKVEQKLTELGNETKKLDQEPMSEIDKENKKMARINSRIETITKKLETVDGEKKIKLEQKLAKAHEKLLEPASEKKQVKKSKEEKDEEKRIAKEKRQLERQANKQKKLEEKEQKKLASMPINLEQGFPTNVKQVYLDGNNMLFVPAYLRNKTLTKGRHSAERALSNMARELGQVLSLNLTHVMFDSTPHTIVGDKFTVSSARPQHETSDDALVEIANQVSNAGLDQDLKDCYLFVTSDRELQVRLATAGVRVVKPGQWFKYAFETLNKQEQEPFEDINQMLQNKFDV